MKIIQLTVLPETTYDFGILYALTDDGKIFMKANPRVVTSQWEEVELPEEIYNHEEQ